MDSPETDRIPSSSSSPSPKFQDSPFFNYLSTLSPIKPSKRTHVGRLFSELSLPPQLPVFSSPRINSHRETDFLKRPQYLPSSDAELSLEYDDGGRILAVESEVSQPSASQLTVELIPHTKEVCEIKGSVQVHPFSPSECVDEFLADPLEECVNSTGSPHLHSSQTTDQPKVLRSGCSGSKEAISDFVDEDGDVRKNTKHAVAMTLTSLGQAGEDPVCANSVDRVKPPEAEGYVKQAGGTQEKNDERIRDEWPHLVSKNVNHPSETGLSTDSASVKQHEQHLVDQNAPDSASFLSSNKECEIVDCEKQMAVSSSGLHNHETQDVKLHPAESGQLDEWSSTPQLLPGSFLTVQADGVHHEDSTAIDNQMPHDCEEANQHQCGMRRRLQFESADDCRRKIGGNNNSWNQSNTLLNAWSSSSPSHAEANTTSSSKQAGKSQYALPRLPYRPFKALQTHINKVDRSAQNGGSSPVRTPMPSGIGLHLNSIGSNIAVRSGPKTQLVEKDCLNAKLGKPLSGSSSHLPPDSKGWLIPASLVGKSSIRLSAKADSPVASSIENTEVDQQENQTSMMASSPTSFRTSPLNMQPLNSLQLTLTEQHLIPCENGMSEDACIFEEMSPRKKRQEEPYSEDVGCKRCNCKKSKCLKLYCDCFAAGLYCGEPCTCQECFNKPEYEDMVLGTRQQIESRNPLAFAPKIVRHIVESPLNNAEDGNLTTPASARHKRGCNCKKSRCLKKYCECYQAGVGCSAGCRCEGCANVFGKKDGFGDITEVEHRKAEDERLEDLSDQKLDVVEFKRDTLLKEQSHADLSPLTPLYRCSRKSPRSPKNLNSSRPVTAREANAGLALHDRELDRHVEGEVDPFSPGWDGLAGLCDVTPLQQHHPSKAAASSSSDIECSKDPQAQLCHGSSCLSVSPHRQRGSPVTPTARFRGSKFVMHPDSIGGLNSISEDETPDILKETYSPIKAVKTSSPNQKRVSPPHNCLHELRRSSSSPGLRSGRKFILQSVPSFPPLDSLQ
ncbi:uncharacterized protein LOC131223239 isoform X2 [Magnolia sinica]|uniref:uncharacterized protein LOC131223239 isoform X2 n=1 Tax=Magnolia sinica TaxID=86752 RepID=UPI0026599410|nr:uncharacterized protein LOC131223239 isoform X2 [Magnolia sinica]